MTFDPNLEEAADRIVDELDTAMSELTTLREEMSSTRADAERTYRTALLEARALGHTSREERDAHAVLQAIDQRAAADLAEMAYRDKNTYVRVLQSQLELIRTRMATNRALRV